MAVGVRGARAALLVSTCLIGLAAVPVRGETGVAFQGSVTPPAGTTITSSGNTDTITVSRSSTVLDWTPNMAPVSGNTIDFLPEGKTAAFVGAPGLADYVVLNRITAPVAPGAGAVTPPVIAFNGTVTSRLTDAAGSQSAGGAVWFYSPGGILLGSSARFDIGSLLLTTSNVALADGAVERNRITVGATGRQSAVEIRNGAQITAGAPGSYVAVVAPRIDQAGSVSVNGSAAYVAAQAADIRINRGLFDIDLAAGATTGGVELRHGGSTTGPAADAGGGEAHRVYMVAVPANDAVTMLVGGTVGFAAAAGVENGVVVLSAGTGTADLTPRSTGPATNASLEVTGANFTSRVVGTVLGQTSIRSTGGESQVRFGQGVELVSRGGVTIDAQGTGALIEAAPRVSLTTGGIGGGSVLLRANSGGTVALRGDVRVDTSPAAFADAAGSIRLDSGGGRLELGETQLIALGRSTGNGQGGQVVLNLEAGGSATLTGLMIDVSATGAPGQRGRGGEVSLRTAAGSALTVGGGGFSIVADGTGGPAGAGTGGAASGIGGRIDLDIGGSLDVRQLMTLSANGTGANGISGADGTTGIAGGVGEGGRITVALSGPASLRDVQMYARGRGGAGGATAREGGRGGNAATSGISFDARGDIVSGTVTVDAGVVAGDGGQALTASDDAINGAGGDARGGPVTMRSGGTARFGDGVALIADATGGSAPTGSGRAGAAGTATAGAVNFTATGPSTRIAQSLTLSADATGGLTVPFVPAGVAQAGSATVETYGNAEVWALRASANASGGASSSTPQTVAAGKVSVTAYGTLDVRSSLALDARATVRGGLLNVGTVRGGGVSLRAASDGGAIGVGEALTLNASADGTVPAGAGQPVGTMDAVAGTVTLSTVEAVTPRGATGGAIRARAGVTLRADATGGEGFNGGDATGGTIVLAATPGGTLDFTDALTASAIAISGVNRDGSSQAHGGDFALEGGVGSTIAVGGRTTVALSGTARDGGGGFSGGIGTGGSARIALAGAGDPALTRLTLGAVAIAAGGAGGGSGSATGDAGGGSGQGGSVTIDLDNAASRLASLDIRAGGIGGNGRRGGDGRGGDASLIARGGTLTIADALSVTLPGDTAGRDAFGVAEGGDATVDARNGARVELGSVALASIGRDPAGQARPGTLRLGASNGTLALTAASLEGSLALPLPPPAIRGAITASGDVRVASRGTTDRFTVGGGPATLDIAASNDGSSGGALLVAGGSAVYTGPGTGRFGVLNRVTGLEPGQTARLEGRIVAEAPAGGSSTGEILFQNADGVALVNGSGFSGRRLVLTSDPAARPDVSAGAFQGTPDVVRGDVGFERTATLDTLTIRSRTALIDWTPNDTATSGVVDFLPAGAIARFQADPALLSGFTVLNRVLPTAGGRPVAFNGTVQSRVAADGGGYVPGGTLWFYSPGGIVAGPGAVFDVGSLLLSTNAVMLDSAGLFDADGDVRLVADANSLSQVSVAAGTLLSASDFNGSVVLAGARVEQQGSVTVDGLAAYVAAADVRINVRRSEATMLAASAATGTLLTHAGSTTGRGADGSASSDATNRILLLAAGAGGGTVIEAGGTLGFGVLPAETIRIAAGLNPGGGIIAAGNGARLTGGDWTSAVSVTATGDVVVDGAGATRFASDVRLTGGSVLVRAGAGATLGVGGRLRLAAGEGAALVVTEAGGAIDVRDDLRLIGGDTRLRVGGVLSSTDLLADASGRNGRAEIEMAGGSLSVRNSVALRADGSAAGVAGGVARLRGGGGEVRVGSLDLTATGGAGMARGGEATVDLAGTTLTVNGPARLDASGSGMAGTARFVSSGESRLAGLELLAQGVGGGRVDVALAAAALSGDLNAVTSGDVTVTSGGLLSIGGALDLDADGGIMLNAAQAGGTIASTAITARAGGAIDTAGVGLSGGTVALTGATISTGDVRANGAVSLRTLAGALSTGAISGAVVTLDSAGGLSTGGIAATGDVRLTARNDLTSHGDISAAAFSGMAGGSATLAGVRGGTLTLIAGRDAGTGALTATTGGIEATAAGGALATGLVTAANSVTLTAATTLDAGAVGGASVALRGESVRVGDVSATIGPVTAEATLGTLAIGQIAAGGAVALTAASGLNTGAVRGTSVSVRGGTVSGGTLTATGGDVDASAIAGALSIDGAVAEAGTVRLTGRDAVDFAIVRAGRDVRVTGPIAGTRDLTIVAGGTADIAGMIARGGAVTIAAAGALTLGDALADRLTLRGGSLAGGTLRSRGGLDASAATGALTLGGVEATGAASLAASGRLTVGDVQATGLSLNGLAVSAGALRSSGGIAAEATSGALAFTSARAESGVVVAATDGIETAAISGGDVRVIGDLVGAGALTLDATGGIDLLGAIRRNGAVSLTAPRLALRDARATELRLRGGNITGGALVADAGGIDAVANGGGLQLASATARDGVRLSGTGGVAIGAASAGGALAVTGDLSGAGDLRLASGGALSFAGDIVREGAVALDAGGDLSLAGVTGGTVRLRGANVAAGAISARDGVDATATGGALRLGNVSTNGALTLAATGGAVTLGDATAGAVRLRGARLEGGALSGTSIDIAATDGPATFTSLSAGGTLALSATGDLLVGRFMAGGAASVSGNAVTIDTGGASGGINLAAGGAARIGSFTETSGGISIVAETAEIVRLDAAGTITATTNGALSVAEAGSRGGIALASRQGGVMAGTLNTAFQSGAAVQPVVLPTAGDVTVTAARDVALGRVSARGVLRVDAGGVARFDGLASGAAIEVTSADIAIAEAARLGGGATTANVRLTVRPGVRAFIGDGVGGADGYALDGGEVGRVRARQIVVSAGRAGTAADRPADVTVGTLALRHEAGGGEASLYGRAALFRVETPGTARVAGRVSGTGFGREDRVEIAAGERLDVVAPVGGIALTGAGGLPSGRLLLSSDRVVVASDAAARDVAALPTARARGERLGMTDGAVAENGYVAAGGIEFRVGQALYIQNSGGSTLESRAGFTTGQDGLSISGTGANPPEVIINGRGVDGGGVVTQSGAAFQPAIASAAPGSSINGCDQGGGLCAPTVAMLEMTVPSGRATNNSSLMAVQGMEPVSTGAGVASAISGMSGTADAEEAGDGEGSGGKAAGRPSARILISARGIAGASLMPLIDEPVTSVGNDDFWLDTMLDTPFAP